VLEILNFIEAEFRVFVKIGLDDLLDLVELLTHEVKLLIDVVIDIRHLLAQILDLLFQTVGSVVDLVIQIGDTVSQSLSKNDVLMSDVRLD
jgi:phage-related protein